MLWLFQEKNDIIITERNHAMDLKHDDVKFIAHRGMPAEAPENSRASFELACREQYWGMEFDIWETLPSSSDKYTTTPGEKKFAVTHNESLMRMCGKDIPVTGLTPEQVKDEYSITKGSNAEKWPGQKILFLEEVLDIMKDSELVPVIELKDTGMSEQAMKKFINILDAYDMAESCMIVSFRDALLSRLRDQAEKTDRVMNLYYTTAYGEFEKEDLKNIQEAAVRAVRHRYNGINPHHSLMDRDLFRYVKDMGLEIATWTIDNSEEAKKILKEYKIDYLVSNRKLFTD